MMDDSGQVKDYGIGGHPGYYSSGPHGYVGHPGSRDEYSSDRSSGEYSIASSEGNHSLSSQDYHDDYSQGHNGGSSSESGSGNSIGSNGYLEGPEYHPGSDKENQQSSPSHNFHQSTGSGGDYNSCPASNYNLGPRGVPVGHHAVPDPEDIPIGHQSTPSPQNIPAEKCPAARVLETLKEEPFMPPEFPDPNTPLDLMPCTICNRTFNPMALDRHRKICQKVTPKKRKVFDSTKQRYEGTDMKPPPKTPDRKDSPPAKSKKSKWREKHQEFLRAIRAARDPEEGDETGSTPTKHIPSDYIQCQHCERHFGPKAADRHITWCKEQNNRVKANNKSVKKLDKLKLRTKYVPPKPGESGWRAPKKKDVISSIPPPSTGPTTIPGRGGSPPPRGASPPKMGSPYLNRHMSPPPGSLSRRTSSASVSSLSRSGSMSLGRNAGKSVASMLNSVMGGSSAYGQSSNYGQSSGYGQSSSYGQPSGHSRSYSRSPELSRRSSGYGQSSSYSQSSGYGQKRNSISNASNGSSYMPPDNRSPLQRSNSVRSSVRSSKPKTRRRNLAEDMMASVCINKSARGEPEGDEDTMSMVPSEYGDYAPSRGYSIDDDDSLLLLSKSASRRQSSTKLAENYDPFSAAELQMQALLGPTTTTTSRVTSRGPSRGLSRESSCSPPRKGSGLGAAGLGLSMETVRQEAERELSPGIDIMNIMGSIDRLANLDDYFSIGKIGSLERLNSFENLENIENTNKCDTYRKEEPTISLVAMGNQREASPPKLNSLNKIGSIESLNIRDKLSPARDKLGKKEYFGSREKLNSTREKLSTKDYYGSREKLSSARERLGSKDLFGSKDSLVSREKLSIWDRNRSREGTPDYGRKSEEKRSVSPDRWETELKSLSKPGYTPRSLYTPSSPSVARRRVEGSSSSSGYGSRDPASELSLSGTPLSSYRGRTSQNSTLTGLSSLTSRGRLYSSMSERNDSETDRKVSGDGVEDNQFRACSLSASSGSSSDGSLPPLTSPLPGSAGTHTDNVSSSTTMPRFCHECGHKYPVMLAKFCCQCGSRRVGG